MVASRIRTFLIDRPKTGLKLLSRQSCCAYWIRETSIRYGGTHLLIWRNTLFERESSICNEGAGGGGVYQLFLRGNPAYVMKGIHLLRGESRGIPPKRRKMLKHNYWYGSRAGAKVIRDKCEQSLNNHGNDCKGAPSRSCTLSRQWRNLSNLLSLNLSDAANTYFSKKLKASVRNVYCWFTNSCFGDWELPNAKSCEAIVSWSLKHN